MASTPNTPLKARLAESEQPKTAAAATAAATKAGVAQTTTPTAHKRSATTRLPAKRTPATPGRVTYFTLSRKHPHLYNINNNTNNRN